MPMGGHCGNRACVECRYFNCGRKCLCGCHVILRRHNLDQYDFTVSEEEDVPAWVARHREKVEEREATREGVWWRKLWRRLTA